MDPVKSDHEGNEIEEERVLKEDDSVDEKEEVEEKEEVNDAEEKEQVDTSPDSEDATEGNNVEGEASSDVPHDNIDDEDEPDHEDNKHDAHMSALVNTEGTSSDVPSELQQDDNDDVDSNVASSRDVDEVKQEEGAITDSIAQDADEEQGANVAEDANSQPLGMRNDDLSSSEKALSSGSSKDIAVEPIASVVDDEAKGDEGTTPAQTQTAPLPQDEVDARAHAARQKLGSGTVVEQPSLGPDFDEEEALDQLAFDDDGSDSQETPIDPLELALYDPPPIMEYKLQFTAGVAGYFDRKEPDDHVDEPAIEALCFHPTAPWMLVGAGFYAELWDLMPPPKPSEAVSSSNSQDASRAVAVADEDQAKEVPKEEDGKAKVNRAASPIADDDHVTQSSAKPLLAFAWRLECDARCVRFCPLVSTNLFATSGRPFKSGASSIEFWSTKQRERAFTLPCYQTVRAMEFHAQLPWLFCVSDPHAVLVFNWQSRTELFCVRAAHQDRINSLRLHHTLPLFCTGSHDLTVKVWDYQLLRAKHGCPFIASAAAGDGNALLAPPKRVGSNAVRAVSVLSTAACSAGHKAAVRFALFDDQLPSADHANQLCLVTGGRDGTVRCWTLVKERDGLRYKVEASFVSRFSLSRTVYDAAFVQCPGGGSELSGPSSHCLLSYGSERLMLSAIVFSAPKAPETSGAGKKKKGSSSLTSANTAHLRSLMVPGPVPPEAGPMTALACHHLAGIFAVAAEDGSVTVVSPRANLWPTLVAQADASLDEKTDLWVAFLSSSINASRLLAATSEFADAVASRVELENGASDGLFDVHGHEDVEGLLKSQFVAESDRASITFTVGFNKNNDKIVHAKYSQSEDPEEAEAFLWGLAVHLATHRMLRTSETLMSSEMNFIPGSGSSENVNK